MNGIESLWHSYWWILPLVFMILCCLGGRGRGRSGICGFGFRDKGTGDISPSDSARDILDKRYALGQISREEYEERKMAIGEETP